MSSSIKRPRQVTIDDLLPRSRLAQRLRARNERLHRQCAFHLANLHAQTILQTHLQRTHTHAIFDIDGIVNLILEYQPSRDVYFFFDKLVSDYSTLILHPENHSTRIDHEIAFPYPTPALTRGWSEESFHLAVEEIEATWTEKRYIPQRCCDEHALAPFARVILTALRKSWTSLFLSVSQLCIDEPDSSATYAQLLLLIARTSFMADCEATRLTMDTIPAFEAFYASLTRYHMRTAPRGVPAPGPNSELDRVVQCLYPDMVGTSQQTAIEIFRRLNISTFMQRAILQSGDICKARRQLHLPLEREVACSQNFLFCRTRPLPDSKLTPYKNLAQPIFSERTSFVFKRDGTAVPSSSFY
jgi:hypothetical protein